jgi:hypothetical protein
MHDRIHDARSHSRCTITFTVHDHIHVARSHSRCTITFTMHGHIHDARSHSRSHERKILCLLFGLKLLYPLELRHKLMRRWRVSLEHRRPLFRSGISLDVRRETMLDLAGRDKIDVGQLCDPRGNAALNIWAIHFRCAGLAKPLHLHATWPAYLSSVRVFIISCVYFLCPAEWECRYID